MLWISYFFVVSTSSFCFSHQIFVLPHSHCDVGWVRTIDEYFDGFVSDIYTTAVSALEIDQNRKFQAVEMAFFKRWWEMVASKMQQELVHTFVEEKRWEFAGGGWVMPDEACTDYIDLIETITYGHRWIAQIFGTDAVPKISFQVDPFGASSGFALITAKMGFDVHIISRINYWEKEFMQQTKMLQFLWQPSSSLGSTAQIFTHVMDQYSYCSPFISREEQVDGLCNGNATGCKGGGFYWNGDNSQLPSYWVANPPYPPVSSDNVQFYADYIVNNSDMRVNWFSKDILLWAWGCDFQHFNATVMFDSMDRVVTYINDNNKPGDRYDGIEISYGTLGQYFSLAKPNIDELHTRYANQSDFMPYSNNEGGVRPWTGYYTSHPTIKQYSRWASSMLRTAEQLYTITAIKTEKDEIKNEIWSKLEIARQIIAELQHHDAITGTMGPGEIDHPERGNIGKVAQMYMDDLDRGVNMTREILTQSLTHLVRSVPQLNSVIPNTSSNTTTQYTTNQFPSKSKNDLLPKFDISVESIWDQLKAGNQASIVIYNPLAWKQHIWIKIPVPDERITITHWDGHVMHCQVNEFPSQLCQSDVYNFKQINTICAPYMLHFMATLPALGYETYIIEISDQGNECKHGENNKLSSDTENLEDMNDVITIDNNAYSLSFNLTTGLLYEATDRVSEQSVNITQNILLYQSFGNNSAGAVSGAYVFRPIGQAQTLNMSDGAYDHPLITKVVGPYVQEIWQEFSPTIFQLWRIYTDPLVEKEKTTKQVFCCAMIELDFGLGPLDGNKELISRFVTDINTDPFPNSQNNNNLTSIFYSDSNGWQTMLHEYDNTQNSHFTDDGYVIASNYVPFIRTSFIKKHGNNSGKNLQLTALARQSHGCTSQRSGELEIMLHRRTLQDDRLGACFAPNHTTNRSDDCPAEFIPNNITTRAFPSLRLLLADPDQSNLHIPIFSQAINNHPVIFYSKSTHWVSQFRHDFSAKMNIPESMHLLTFAAADVDVSKIILRLQHIYESSEDWKSKYSDTIQFSIPNILGQYWEVVGDINETSLSTIWPFPDSKIEFDLNPQDIKTFLISMKYVPDKPSDEGLTTVTIIAVVVVAVILCLILVIFLHRAHTLTRRSDYDQIAQ